MSRKNVLFICTHNAARSQMAEGYLRARYGDRYNVFSAGTRASTVNRHAIQTMREIGVDISSQVSKSLETLQGKEMDITVTLCDDQKGVCPVYPCAKEMVHARFADPGEFIGDDETLPAQFRTLREEITHWIDGYFGQSRTER
jgi:arsenate reductase